MTSITITLDDQAARSFLVRVEGELRRPKSLHDALGRRLARELQGYFRARNKEPNKFAAPKTNFWKQVADATVMTEATAEAATVTIAESRFRIHLFGGTIKPTGGRRFLTIPLVKEAHGRRVEEYEKSTGRKLFRLGFGKVLMERADGGDRSLVFRSEGTVRNRSGGFRRININSRTRMRPVFALSKQATVKADPRALPAQDVLAAALQDTADKWLARALAKGGAA